MSFFSITICQRFVALITIMLVSHSLVFCCRGGAPATPELASEHAEAVFLGKVVDFQTDSVRFVVEKVWKGSVQSEITLPNIRSCPAFFDVGEKYVVYASSLLGPKVGLIVSTLHRHVRVDLAAADLAFWGYQPVTSKPPQKFRGSAIRTNLMIVGASLALLGLFVFLRGRWRRDE